MEENKTAVQQKKTAAEETGVVEILMKYLAYWPWIVASAVVCLIVAFVWLRYQTPTYSTTASVLIKDNDQSKGKSNFNGLDAMQNLGVLTMTSNFDNELEVLKSRTLVERVVSDLGLYMTSYIKRTTGYDTPLYKNEPFQFYMAPEVAANLPGGIRIDSKYTTEEGLQATIKYRDEAGNKQEIRQTFKHYPSIWSTKFGAIFVTDSLFASMQKAALESAKETGEEPNLDFEMYTIIQTPLSAAIGFKNRMSVGFTSKTTTIAVVSLTTPSRKMGEDFINQLVKVYNMDANDEKNQVAMRTAEFIESRLLIINSELGETDNKMASFKQQSGLTDLTSDAQLALQENTRYEQKRTENEMQINLVKYLRDYINDPVNKNQIIPANVGLTDVGLTTAITAYNQVITERRRLLQTASENNPAVQNLNVTLEAAQTTVKKTVESVLKGLNISKANLERENYKFTSRISSAPTQEKEFLDIKRQQDIKAALYTTLLGKREENAINLSAVANNGRLIEKPLSGSAPVAPRKSMIMLIALIIGIAIPVAFIYLRELFQFNITKPEDLDRLTQISMAGALPNAKKVLAADNSIVVHENKNNIMEEAFRRLRTNILFMLEPGENVIMITSSISGEGKSFVASNLACSLAYLGKKVIVVGADIRRLGLNKSFGLPKRAKGLTNHLVHPDAEPLTDLIYHSELSPNLDILFGGSIPPNPTELLSRPIFGQTIQTLSQQYDYVILDTAPIGMTTDSNIISRNVDVCLYVCRMGVTPKAAISIVNDLKNEGRVKRVGIIVNDLMPQNRQYNYGKRYGYSYRSRYSYAYGYGYGYGFDNEKKKE